MTEEKMLPSNPTSTDVATTNQESIPRFTLALVEETQRQIATIKGMVKSVLVNGVDYGRLPGTPA